MTIPSIPADIRERILAAADELYQQSGRESLPTVDQVRRGVERTADQYLRNVLRSRWLLADLGEYRALHALIGNDWHSLGEKVGAGGSLLRNRGDGTFERIRDSTTDRAGWAWGSAFLDLDNDSDLDLYVANGWISAARDTDL